MEVNMESVVTNGEKCSVKEEQPGVTFVGSNRKERKRTQCINLAFSELRKCIPNVPTDTKLSKIKTLRLAISYIQYLTEVLDEEEDGARKAKIIAYGIANKNDFVAKRKKIIKSEDKDTKQVLSNKYCRTGWPQHVWALDLR